MTSSSGLRFIRLVPTFSLVHKATTSMLDEISIIFRHRLPISNPYRSSLSFLAQGHGNRLCAGFGATDYLHGHHRTNSVFA